ncbi:MAG: diguanylate cyclase [Lachnospiraceae bacterium]|nr:diguanylate cyclase [Lachnospiraceae bacterium]
MTEKLKKIKSTLDTSIFVGERYEKNLSNIAVTAGIVLMMCIVMTALNIIQGKYAIAVYPFIFCISTIVSLISVLKYKKREGAVAVTIPAIIIVLTLDVLFADNGFAYLWTMLVPLAVCYMFSVKTGIYVTAYLQLLVTVVFYTPVRSFVAPRYPEIVMSRFPLLFFFHGLLVLFVMYRYHNSVLFEIEHTDRLNGEVAKQTAVAEERARRIEQMSFQTIQTLANAIDAKDPYTKGHSTRVSQYSVMLAEALGWDKERVDNLKYAAMLHDIGKIGVPDSILNKPRRLTDMEYDIIKAHTTMGGDILKNRIIIGMAEEVARSHHERYDGSGYPAGLKGDEISEEARIVGIADSFDAMSSNRIYRKACSTEHIRHELEEGRGKQFDPDFAERFIRLWDQGLLDHIIQEDEEENDENIEESSALLQEVVKAFASQNEADNIDITTGVMNRTFGETAIAQSMEGESGCFIFFDVDNLKKINDTNGHEAGDRVLKYLGDTLRENSENGLCCRLGGDEFLMFIKNASKEEAEARVRRIISGFDEKKDKDPETRPASLSAGMAVCTRDDTYTKVFNMADKALYHVKQNGKKGFDFYNSEGEYASNEPVDVKKLVESIRNSGDYKGAIDVEYRQFVMLYEYIVNLEKRFAHPFKLVMITLEFPGGEDPRIEELEKAMYYMEHSIRRTIRDVDIITRYSRQQFLIILLGADADGVRNAVDRIFRGYYKMSGNSIFSPDYSVIEPDEHSTEASHK